MRHLTAIIFLFLLTVVPAAAQGAQGFAQEGERIEIGLSTENIAITSSFDGTSLTIFGAIDNVNPRIQRQGGYDVFVVLEGPRANVVARRKGRVLGIWMNVDSQAFLSVPESYLVASTRQARDISNPETLRRLSLGTDEIAFRPTETLTQGEEGVVEFAAALRRLKEQGQLYKEFPTGVRFISRSLFRAQIWVPANIPLGQHKAHAYLFRNGHLTSRTEATLQIRKAGLEAQLFQAAQDQSILYGGVSVALALLIGWLGRVMFKRD